MTSLQSVATLILSVAALAFAVWIALANPDHQSVYGPSPAVAAAAVSA